MDITVYSARKVVAEVNHSNSSHWVDITVTELVRGCERDTEVTFFFEGPNAATVAERLATAINNAKADISAIAEMA